MIQKAFGVFILYLLLGISINAQENKPDFELGNTPVHQKVSLHLQNAHLYKDSLPKLTIRYCDSVIILLKSNNNVNFGNTLEQTYLLKGDALFSIKQYKVASHYYQLSIDIAKSRQNKQLLAQVLFSNGISNFKSSEYDKSLLSLHESLTQYKSLKSKKNIAACYHYIGRVHDNLNNLEQAETYYRKALDYQIQLRDDDKVGRLLQNLGTLELSKEEYDKAAKYFEKALKIFERLNDTIGIGAVYSNLGLIDLNKMEPQKAKVNFKNAQHLFIKTNYTDGYIWTQHNIAICTLDMGYNTIAERLFKESIQTATENQHSEGILANYHELYLLKLGEENHKSALNYYKQYVSLRDSIHSSELQSHIAEIETLHSAKYNKQELAKKDVQIKKKNIYNRALWGMFTILLIASGFILYSYRQKSIAEKNLEEHQKNLEKLVEERTLELQEQISGRKFAEESDKLKSAFLANMSHELLTPMNAIIAFSSFLKDPELSDELKNDYINHISTAGNSLLHLIDDIIDIAKIESRQLRVVIKPTNLTRLMTEIYDMFKRSFYNYNKSNLNFVLDIESEKQIIVNIDEHRVKQIVSNLLDNAFKYTQKGQIRFGYKTDTNYIGIFVHDTGIGIPENKHEAIFDRFYQLHSSSQQKSGTGLGLAICKNLVELMGGKISIHSKSGIGSKFLVELPVDSIKTQYIPKNNNGIKNSSLVNNINFENKTILVAEDEELNFKVLDSVLSRTKARILRAKDGATAVEIFQKENIDIILMDIQMPIMDGYDATRIIKQLDNTVPVIVQTSFAMDGEKEKCFAAGCDDFVTKPLDLNLLIEKIKGLLVV